VRDDDYGEERDPLLVRPFLLHDSGAAGDESGQTWPSATTREVRSQRAFEGADDPTTILELPAASVRKARHARRARHSLLLAGAAGAVVLLGVAAAGFVAARSEVRPLVSAALPAEPLPAVTAAQPTTTAPAPAVSTPAAARPATTEPVRTSTTESRAPSAAAPILPRVSPAAPIGTTTAIPVPPPDNRLAPQPATDRTGVIRGQNGLCLDLAGGIPFDGNQVQVFTCNDTAAQRWTLAADGTMRVSGRCALLAGDNTVHIVGCEGRTTAQWKSSGQLLINAAGGGCLTDPSSGRASGTAVTVAPCGRSAGQRWSLP
jgi:hypothetical protein